MTQLSKLAAEALDYASCGNQRSFIGYGVAGISDDSAERGATLSNLELRQENLRVMKELIDAGFIELLPQPGIKGPIDHWPSEPNQWLPMLASLWPVGESRPQASAFG